MMTGWKRWGFTLLVIACVAGTAALIWVGHTLFQNRPRIFWLFSLYAVLVSGVVIFFGFRLSKFQSSEKE